MHRILKLLIFFLALISFIGCDQLTKTIARRGLTTSPPATYLHGIVRLEYAENPGLFMSIGATLPEDLRSAIHAATGALVFIGFIFLAVKAPSVDRMRWAGSCLLLAGASGNLLDRLTNDGRVIDFIMIDLGRLRTGVFNVADLLILTGVVLLLFGAGRRKDPVGLPDDLG
jgi:signal peptidase II